MLCGSISQDSRGIVNGACYVLPKTGIKLSDEEDRARTSKGKNILLQMLESSSRASSQGFTEDCMENRKTDNRIVSASSCSSVRDVFDDMSLEFPIMGDISVRTTRNMNRQYQSPNHETSGGGFWTIKRNNHPFNRAEVSAEDKQRLAFTAAAVIKAACEIVPKRNISGKGHERRATPVRDGRSKQFKIFGISEGAFAKWQGPKPVNDGTYIGTNRGRFMPSPWISSEDTSKRGHLQAINVQGQYKNCSFEELRLGDYVRDRTRAPHLFSLFRKLPAELRMMVWKFALEPRVVELRYNAEVTSCWTPCPTPNVFSVCRESRTEALKSYRLSFGLPDSPTNIYFCSSLDTLFLTIERSPGGDGEESSVEDLVGRLKTHCWKDVLGVKHLAIDEALWSFWNETWADRMSEYMEFVGEDDDDDEDCPLIDCLPSFTKLKTLQIVRNDVYGFWKQNSALDVELEEEDFVSENVEFLPLSRSAFLDGLFHFCDCTLKKLKAQDPEWSMPSISFMTKTEKYASW